MKAFTGQIDPQRLLEELSNTGKVTGRAKAKTQITFDSDAVDAFLAARFVQLLDETVARIGKYDDLKMYQTHPRVARYFDEAHRCFLFGMDIACAVLCRALLEAALIERVDPHHKLKQTVSPKESYISKMLTVAVADGFLETDREAERVKEAGNWAIHHYDKFRNKYSNRMGEIVEEMRRILIDLYDAKTQKVARTQTRKSGEPRKNYCGPPLGRQ